MAPQKQIKKGEASSTLSSSSINIDKELMTLDDKLLASTGSIVAQNLLETEIAVTIVAIDETTAKAEASNSAEVKSDQTKLIEVDPETSKANAAQAYLDKFTNLSPTSSPVIKSSSFSSNGKSSNTTEINIDMVMKLVTVGSIALFLTMGHQNTYSNELNKLLQDGPFGQALYMPRIKEKEGQINFRKIATQLNKDEAYVRALFERGLEGNPRMFNLLTCDIDEDGNIKVKLNGNPESFILFLPFHLQGQMYVEEKLKNYIRTIEASSYPNAYYPSRHYKIKVHLEKLDITWKAFQDTPFVEIFTLLHAFFLSLKEVKKEGIPYKNDGSPLKKFRPAQDEI